MDAQELGVFRSCGVTGIGWYKHETHWLERSGYAILRTMTTGSYVVLSTAVARFRSARCPSLLSCVSEEKNASSWPRVCRPRARGGRREPRVEARPVGARLRVEDVARVQDARVGHLGHRTPRPHGLHDGHLRVHLDTHAILVDVVVHVEVGRDAHEPASEARGVCGGSRCERAGR